MIESDRAAIRQTLKVVSAEHCMKLLPNVEANALIVTNIAAAFPKAAGEYHRVYFYLALHAALEAFEDMMMAEDNGHTRAAS
jgi:hypothetical protein